MTEPKQKAPRADAPSSAESLPALVGRLSEDLTTLVDSKLSLFKLEVKEDLRSYLRGGIRVGAGVLVAGVGFGLVSAATALCSRLSWRRPSISPLLQPMRCAAFSAVCSS